MRSWKKSFHANGNQEAGAATLISDETDLKTIVKDEEKHYLTIKGSILEEDTIIIYVNPT